MKTILILLLTSAFTISFAEQSPDIEKVEGAGVRACKWIDEDSLEIDPSDENIRISADNASHVEGEMTTLSGDVKITGRGQEIRASLLTIDNNTQSYSGEGSISLNKPDFFVRGEKIQGNLLNETANLERASFLLKDSLLRGNAKSLRQEKNRISIVQGTITSCGSRDNTWSYRAGKLS